MHEGFWFLQVIAAEVGGGRSAANCLQRWSRRGLGTALKKGKWDEAEDQALLQVRQTLRCRQPLKPPKNFC